MFNSLTNNFKIVIKKLRGQGYISPENINELCQEIKKSLIEADVALDVVNEFIYKVKVQGIGTKISNSLTPGQEFIKIINKELTFILGEGIAEPLNVAKKPPAVILVAGLQGAGKTTNIAKIAYQLKKNQKKNVMLVSADVYRPAAIDQLRILAETNSLKMFPSSASDTPQKIVLSALHEARKKFVDVLLVDTAGRMQIDEDMMQEIKELHKLLNPIETLFVVDSMTGQDAANTAKAFNEQLPLTGIVLSKTDGDARGGAALSIRSITQKPIKFLGIGEKIEDLEVFYPNRIAGQILGMGDMMTLIEDVESKVDKSKFFIPKKNKVFNLNDFQEQLKQLEKMGGISSIASKLPGFNRINNGIDQAQNKEFISMTIIIQSMTKQEKLNPEIIKGSRKRRIATGCGKEVQDINRMLKQFMSMQKMFKKSSTLGMKNMLRTLKSQQHGSMF